MPSLLFLHVAFIATVRVFGFIQGRSLWYQKSARFLEDIHRRQQELADDCAPAGRADPEGAIPRPSCRNAAVIM